MERFSPCTVAPRLLAAAMFRAAAMVGATAMAGSLSAQAAEPDRTEDITARFVEQLRAEGHGDLVADFLERAESDPLVSETFRRRVPVERVAAQLAEALEEPDPTERVAALTKLEPEVGGLGTKTVDARRLAIDFADRLAVSAADLARRDAITAEREDSASQRAAARDRARASIDAARAKLTKAESLIVAERDTLKGAQPASPEGRRRADLGARLGLVRLLAARLLHEKAMTYPEQDGDRNRLNLEAAKELGDLYAKYSKLGVGLYAHLYEGRCYRLLGDKQRAAAALEDLTAQPAPTPDLRRVVTLAHAELAALALDGGDAAAALAKPADWLEGLDADERDGPEAATLRYRVALATLAVAEQGKEADQRRLKRDARELLGEAARVPSDVQAEAREQWLKLSAALGVETAEPKDFDEATAAATEALESMTALDEAIATANEASKPGLAEQRRVAAEAAYKAVGAAVSLARDKKVDPEALARTRYQLAWLDWDRGDVSNAATRAAFVARQDAATESGEPAAKLALAALERAQREGDAAAGEKLRELAAFILKQWPEGETSAAASSVLLSEALRSDDLEAAKRVVASVPASQRTTLSLRLAVTLWERLRSDPAQAPGALAELRSSYESAAASGAGTATPLPSTPLLSTAALYLADLALDGGDFEQAKTLLCDKSHGPAAMLEQNSPPANAPAFALAASKSLARHAALADGDLAAAVDRFGETLAAFPAETSGGDRAWLTLALALWGDLDRSEGSKPRVAGALTLVLDRAKGLADSADWNTRLWIAQARLRCGEVLEDQEQAKASVVAGRDAFAALVDAAEAKPDYAPSPAAVMAARLRLAQCHRELGDYPLAIDEAAALLATSGAVLEAQSFAAQTLQAWGVAEKAPERLEEAIAGARPGKDGKNVVWGWSKLAAVAGRYAASDPKRQQLYFDAWREVAASRYQAALLADGPAKAEQLRKAASTLLAVQRKNPELGGEENQRAYDKLLRAIQRASGQTPDGLTKAGG